MSTDLAKTLLLSAAQVATLIAGDVQVWLISGEGGTPKHASSHDTWSRAKQNTHTSTLNGGTYIAPRKPVCPSQFLKLFSTWRSNEQELKKCEHLWYKGSSFQPIAPAILFFQSLPNTHDHR